MSYIIPLGVLQQAKYIQTNNGDWPGTNPPTPVNQLKFTGYATTWGHGIEIGSPSSKFQQLDSADVQTVLYAFMDGLNDGTLPRDFTIGHNTPVNVLGMDFGPAITMRNVKDDVLAMRFNGIEAYFSVGGATYTDSLPLVENEGIYIIENPSTVRGDVNVPILNKMIEVIEFFDIAGLDVDWEDLTVNPLSVDYAWRLYTFTKALRWAVDQAMGDRKLAIASFSTAWDNTALTNAGTNNTIPADHGLISAWGGNAGQARAASRFTYNGTTYTDFLDCFDSIYIMSYDVGDLVPTADGTWAGTGDKYSAIQAYQDCVQVQKVMGKTIPVYIGIEPPPEGAGLARTVVKTAHATGEESIMRADQYSRSVDVPHAVEYYAEQIKALSSGPDGAYAGGLMMWALWKSFSGDVNNADGHPYATDLTAIAEAKRVFNS